jgi:hypothetical protein
MAQYLTNYRPNCSANSRGSFPLETFKAVQMGKRFPPITRINPIVLLVLQYSQKQHSTVRNRTIIPVNT